VVRLRVKEPINSGSIPGGENFFSSPEISEAILGPPSLLFNRYREISFLEIKRLSSEANLYVVPRLRMRGFIPPVSHMFHDLHRDDCAFIL
jgi:hypothetical protein